MADWLLQNITVVSLSVPKASEIRLHSQSVMTPLMVGPTWLRVELTILGSDCPSIVSWDLSHCLLVVPPYLLCVIACC